MNHHEHDARRSGAVLYLLDDVAATSRAMAALARAQARAATVARLREHHDDGLQQIRARAARMVRRKQRAAANRLPRRQQPQQPAGGRATPFHGGRP